MHFFVRQDALQECLNIVQNAVPAQTPFQIIKGIYVEAKNDILTLVANNLEISITAKCEEAEVIEEGALVLPDRLVDIVRQFPLEKIEFKTDEEGRRAEITGEGVDFFLHGTGTEEFPAIADESLWNQWGKLVFSAHELKSVLKKVLFAVSTDDKRPSFKGVLLEVDETQNLFCMASDTYRLAHQQKNIGSKNDEKRQPLRMLVPGKTLAEVLKILDDSDTEVECYYKENEIIFKYKQFIFSGRLLEDSYPDFSNAFPNKYHTKIVVNNSLLEETLGRAALLARGHNLMLSLSIIGNILQVKSGSEIGSMTEVLNLEKKEGDDLEEIFFNSRFLLDPLRIFEDTFIEIEFNGPFGPCIFNYHQETENGRDLYRYLVLPIKRED